MARIPESFINNLRDQVDLAALVGRYVALKAAGRDFVGLCPFHDEKTPSFNVVPHKQIFHCFGCGESGTAFNFLMKQQGLSFVEAVRALAAEHNMQVPAGAARDEARSGEREQLLHALESAQRYFRAQLQGEGAAAKEARALLRARGLSDADADAHGLGFAPESWDGLARALRAKGVAEETGLRAGLLRARPGGGAYDFLRGRITFPVRDAAGKVLAFGGRALSKEERAKYLNTPETPVFQKRASFYGLSDALPALQKSGRAIIVEGYFDRIAFARAGMREALATCGTALSAQHAAGLRRRADEAVLCFDGDTAGQKAMLRSMELLLPTGLNVRAALLPAGMDPDDYLRKEGPEALRALADEAPAAMDFAIQRATAAPLASAREKAKAVGFIAPLLAKVADPVERGVFVRQLAGAAGCETRDVEAALRREFIRARRESKGLAPTQAQAKAAAAETAADAAEDSSPDQKLLQPQSADGRHYKNALQLALHYAADLGEELNAPQLLALAPEDEAGAKAWRALAETVLQAAESGGVAALLDALPQQPRAQLSALAGEARPDLEKLSAQTLREIYRDTLNRLQQRRLRAANREKLRALHRRQNTEDAAAFLQQAQLHIEGQRSALPLPPNPAPPPAVAAGA